MAGKPNRDRGRKTERAHPHPPAATSVERVDPHTLIVRSPRGFTDEEVAGLALILDAGRLEIPASTVEIVDRPGVWLTPGEVAAMEATPDP